MPTTKRKKPTTKRPPKGAKAAPAASTPTIRVVAATDLVSDQANVRVRDDRAKSTIRASMKQFGPARSGVMSGGVMRAGNGSLEGFIAEGGTEALIVRPEPGQFVVVERDDWSPSEAVGYSIADNRTAELADWDNEGLAETLRALQNDDVASIIGWLDHELEPLLAATWEPEAIDELPTRPEPTHAVTFGESAWETILDAIQMRRAKAQDDSLSEAQCLELICAAYLVPPSDSPTTPAP
jgi:hypothetical protein